MAQHQVKDMQAYAEGFNKGAELIKTQKKLVSVNASFIKSLLSKEYTKSFYQGVADGWDFGFRKEKERLQQQQYKDKQSKRTTQMQQMQGKQHTREKGNDQER